MDLVDSLSENARRMLEIGIVQDELIKMGFTMGCNEIGRMTYFVEDNKPFKLKYIIYFEADRVIIAPPLCSSVYLSGYTITWMEDLLTYVSRLLVE